MTTILEVKVVLACSLTDSQVVRPCSPSPFRWDAKVISRSKSSRNSEQRQIKVAQASARLYSMRFLVSVRIARDESPSLTARARIRAPIMEECTAENPRSRNKRID